MSSSSTVKLRGITFEQTDVLDAIKKHPKVDDVALVVKNEMQRLIAYVVVNNTTGELTVAELRDWCKSNLQPQLVPDWIFLLSSFPKNNEGRIDRHKLPAVTDRQQQGLAVPRDTTDLAILNIFEDLLQKFLGIDDDFFAAGGHSLLAVELLVKIEEKTGVRLPISDMLTKSTVRTLADAVVSQVPASIEGEITEYSSGQGGEPFFLLHGDYTGGGFFAREIANAANLIGPFYIVQPYGMTRDKGLVLPASIEAMADAHLQAIREKQPGGPYRIAGYCNAALIAYEIGQKLVQSGEQVDLLAMIDPPKPEEQAAIRRIKASTLEEFRSQLNSLDEQPDLKDEEEYRTWLTNYYFRISAEYSAKPYPGDLTLIVFNESQKEGWTELANSIVVHDMDTPDSGHITAIQSSAGRIGDTLGNILNAGNSAEPEK